MYKDYTYSWLFIHTYYIYNLCEYLHLKIYMDIFKQPIKNKYFKFS